MSRIGMLASAVLVASVVGCIDGGDDGAPTSAVDEAETDGCTAGKYVAGPIGAPPNFGFVAIPSGCKHVEIKAWGDGGGPGYNPDPGGNGVGGGGGGGYAFIRIGNDQVDGLSRLHVAIGHDASLMTGGNGTSVRWVVDPQGTVGPMIAVAGGGGGGGADDDGGPPYGGGGEQDGGKAAGSSPEPNQSCRSSGGGGASATHAGAGGTASGPWPTNGQPGGPLDYGSWIPTHNGGTSSGGGEGGGGYFGGGGGGACRSHSATGWWWFHGGGGGGGNYTDGGGASVEEAFTLPGTGSAPGNADDPDRCDGDATCAGQGAPPLAGTHGVAGRVVIRWY